MNLICMRFDEPPHTLNNVTKQTKIINSITFLGEHQQTVSTTSVLLHLTPQHTLYTNSPHIWMTNNLTFLPPQTLPVFHTLISLTNIYWMRRHRIWCSSFGVVECSSTRHTHTINNLAAQNILCGRWSYTVALTT